MEARDPAYVRLVAPVLHFFADRYYRAEVEGVEHLLPGPCLIVATHNGIWTLPDLVALASVFLRRFGTELPGYALAHHTVLSLPGIGPLIRRLGAVPASPSNALAVLKAGHPLLVCPGGDLDAMKPFRERHRIHFGHRRGFISLALRAGVPIIPVVSVGAHETLVVLNDGRRLAERLPLARAFRLKTIPLTLSFPFGLTIAGVPSIPLPSKVRVRILPPVDLGLPPESAHDHHVVEHCFSLVRHMMQAALDDLASTRKRVFFG